MFEDNVMRAIFEPEGEKVTAQARKFHKRIFIAGVFLQRENYW
jgi:hypothetical protein